MRKVIILLILSCLTGLIHAQDEQTPYDIALERIEAARQSDATELDLSWLGLTELPPEIGGLSNLQWLNLGGNALTGLPPEIGGLSNLQWLNLGGNQLTSLPPEIGGLENLCVLDLRDNQLRHLPNELGTFDRLADDGCGLGLYGNPLITPPEEVRQQGMVAVLDYLQNQAAWHLRRTLGGFAALVGGLAGVGLLLRWRGRRNRKRKRKNDEA